MLDWLDILLVLAAVSTACLHLGWRWLRSDQGGCASCGGGQCPGQGKAGLGLRRDP